MADDLQRQIDQQAAVIRHLGRELDTRLDELAELKAKQRAQAIEPEQRRRQLRAVPGAKGQFQN